MILPYKLLHPAARAPKFAHADDACFDLTAAYREPTQGNSRIYGTGLAFQIPKGYYLKLAVRSSIAFKKDMILANAIGIIDAGYRGEIMCKLVYLGDGIPDWPVPGDRIMQGKLEKLTKTELQEVKELDETERGANGLGSTGR